MIDECSNPADSAGHEDERPSALARGPNGLGQEAASFLAGRARADSGHGCSPQEALRVWASEAGHLLGDGVFSGMEVVSNGTSEVEVFYNAANNRAWKRTWPGTFGFAPHYSAPKWIARAAGPAELLSRLDLQNEIFSDDIRVEGTFESSGPSMVIGEQSGGVSLGFEEMAAAFYGWKHEDGTIVLDAKPDNFIKSESGIIPIDLQITRTF